MTGSFYLSGKRSVKFRVPKKTVHKAKYNGTGFFKRTCLQDKKLPRVIEDVLVDTVNHAVSQNTKSVYCTGVNILNKCKEELGEKMELPLSERDILIFIGFCAKRGNKAGTIRSYLSGIKKFHVAQGFTDFEYMTPLVKEVIEGHEGQLINSLTLTKHLTQLISIQYIPIRKV